VPAPPFAGLFRTDTLHGARIFEGGFRCDFDEADLNESAKALFHRLDQVFDILDAPGFAFLSTIELDAEAGRFRGRTLRSTALLAGWRPLLRCTPLPRRPCLRDEERGLMRWQV
jgi:hypothetical protein